MLPSPSADRAPYAYTRPSRRSPAVGPWNQLRVPCFNPLVEARRQLATIARQPQPGRDHEGAELALPASGSLDPSQRSRPEAIDPGPGMRPVGDHDLQPRERCHTPSPETVRRLASGLGVDPDVLFSPDPDVWAGQVDIARNHIRRRREQRAKARLAKVAAAQKLVPLISHELERLRVQALPRGGVGVGRRLLWRGPPNKGRRGILAILQRR